MNKNEKAIAVFWHRRDLRLRDNAGLYHALGSGFDVLPLFIFDTHILNRLEQKADARVEFIHNQLLKLHAAYKHYNSSLLVRVGEPLEIFKQLTAEWNIKAVFANEDYEPYARQRDMGVKQFLEGQGIIFQLFKDHVIFEKSEILKSDGSPYTVFTPYMRRWKERLHQIEIPKYNIEARQISLFVTEPFSVPSLTEIGFSHSNISIPSGEINEEIIRQYHLQRDLPAVKGTTRLGVHLRFGTLSIRKLVKQALEMNETWLNELIWREFFQMILYHFPHTVEKSFKPAYDRIEWKNDERLFRAWCEGKTGFPIVDAGMRELAATGFLHNRVRMIAGSFLVKDLLIDWRWGEAWFAQKLLDFEQASNVGNWQWVVGCGCDAAPYFRVFNPTLQAEKFDPKQAYIRSWVPEFDKPDYHKPIVDHTTAKELTIKTFKKALAGF